MALLRRVNVVWSGLVGGPMLSSFWFKHVPGNAVAATSGVDTFWKTCVGKMVSGTIGTVQDDQPIYETTTGLIVAVEQGGVPTNIVGTDATEPLPGFSQGLLRLKTGVFIGGRRVQGHIFLPGPSENVSNGAPLSTYVSAWTAAANTLKTSSGTFGPWSIYSRKNHSEAEISSVSTWSKWAVLRSRR